MEHFANDTISFMISVCYVNRPPYVHRGGGGYPDIVKISARQTMIVINIF